MKTIALILFVFNFALTLNAQIIETEFQKKLDENYYYSNYYDVAEGIFVKGDFSEGLLNTFCLFGNDGSVIDSKFYMGESKVFDSKMEVINATESIHTTYNNSDQTIRLFKASNFLIDWETKYSLAELFESETTGLDWTLDGIKELSNGDICVYGVVQKIIFSGFGATNVPLILLFDETGELIWSKVYDLGNSSLYPKYIYENNEDDLVVVGNYNITISPSLTSTFTLATLNLSRMDGEIIGSGSLNKYNVPSSEFMFSTFNEENRVITTKGFSYGYHTGVKTVLSKINEDGTFTEEKSLLNGGVYSYKSIAIDNNTYLIGFSSIEIGTSMFYQKPTCVKLDSANNVIWAYWYGEEDLDEGVMEFGKHSSEDSTIVCYGNFDETDYIWKMNYENGNIACNANAMTISVFDTLIAQSTIDAEILYTSVISSGESVTPVSDTPTDHAPPAFINVCEKIEYVSINESKELKESILIYPNPNNGKFTIEFSENNNIEMIQIYDLTGKLVYDKTWNENQTKIDISQFSKGIYQAVFIMNSGKTITKKISIH